MRNDREPLLDRLGDENAVEGITVVERELAHPPPSPTSFEEGEDLLRKRCVEVGGHSDLATQRTELPRRTPPIHRYEPGNRLAVSGDHDLLAPGCPIEQPGQLRLCRVHVDLHAGRSLRSLAPVASSGLVRLARLLATRKRHPAARKPDPIAGTSVVPVPKAHERHPVGHAVLASRMAR